MPYCGEERRRVCARSRIAVAGYGKLGGLELGYGSDLDLVFLHDSRGDIQLTEGEQVRSTTACSFCGSGSASCIC